MPKSFDRSSQNCVLFNHTKDFCFVFFTFNETQKWDYLRLKHLPKNLSENDRLDRAHHVLHKISVSGSGVVTINPPVFILILRRELFLYEPTENEILKIGTSLLNLFILTLHDSRCPRHSLHPLVRCTLCTPPSVELPSIFL